MIKLQPLIEDYLEYLRNLRNENRFMFFNSDLISEEQQKKWFKHYRPIADQEEMFIILGGKNDKNLLPVGTLYYKFHNQDEVELGRIIIEGGYRGDGYLQEAISSLLDNLTFKKCFLRTKKDNLKAIEAYKKCHFTIESEFTENNIQGYLMVYHRSK